MKTALEYFRQFAPEYGAMSDSEVQVWIDIAMQLVSRMFGDTDDRMAMSDALYAAHLIKSQEVAVGNGSGGGGVPLPSGALTMEKEGDLQRSYAVTEGAGAGKSNSTGASNPLATTYYGRLFLTITNAVVGAPIMTSLDPATVTV